MCGGYGNNDGGISDQLSACHEYSYDFDEWYLSGNLPSAMDYMAYDFHPTYGLLLAGGYDASGKKLIALTLNWIII